MVKTYSEVALRFHGTKSLTHGLMKILNTSLDHFLIRTLPITPRYFIYSIFFNKFLIRYEVFRWSGIIAIKLAAVTLNVVASISMFVTTVLCKYNKIFLFIMRGLFTFICFSGDVNGVVPYKKGTACGDCQGQCNSNALCSKLMRR